MKNNSNRTLLIVFISLLAIFVLTRLFRSPARESNLNKELFGIDTAQIVSVKLIKHGEPAIILTKTDSSWTVTKETQRASAESYAVGNLMSTLAQLKPDRIVSRNQAKWDAYLVGDTTSVHMTAYDRDDEKVLDWHVGKESQGMTYVRAGGEDEVYTLNTTLRNRIDKNFTAWRDKTFVKIKPAEVRSVKADYPSDSGFVLQNNEGKWTIDNRPADSAAVQKYLSALQSRTLSSFAEQFSAERPPDITLSISDGTQTGLVVKAWKNASDADGWTMTSSAQRGVYFRDAALPKEVFVAKKTLAKK